MKNWYVVNTKPHSEFKVIEFLKSKKIKTFMPQLVVTRSHARKIEKVSRPLFPTYFFTKINIGESFRIIKNTIGVKCILSKGNIPSYVSDIVMQDLFLNTDKNGVIKNISKNFNIGQKVKISEGLLKGRVGDYLGMSSKDRILVFLDFFGRESKISVSCLSVINA